MQVGVGCTVRDHCDGQSLASPGRWPVAARSYPETDIWQEVVGLFWKFSQQFGTKSLLMDLALGRVGKFQIPRSLVESFRRASSGCVCTGCEGRPSNSDAKVASTFQAEEAMETTGNERPLERP